MYKWHEKFALLGTWERQRNEARATVDWQFTAPDARIKLKRLYPSIQDG